MPTEKATGKGPCYKCGHMGHIANECKTKVVHQGYCSVCGRYGHKECKGKGKGGKGAKGKKGLGSVDDDGSHEDHKDDTRSLGEAGRC